MWAELYNDEKVIHHEIRLLSNAHKVLVENQYGRKRATSITINLIFSNIIASLKSSCSIET